MQQLKLAKNVDSMAVVNDMAEGIVKLLARTTEACTSMCNFTLSALIQFYGILSASKCSPTIFLNLKSATELHR